MLVELLLQIFQRQGHNLNRSSCQISNTFIEKENVPSQFHWCDPRQDLTYISTCVT